MTCVTYVVYAPKMASRIGRWNLYNFDEPENWWWVGFSEIAKFSTCNWSSQKILQVDVQPKSVSDLQNINCSITFWLLFRTRNYYVLWNMYLPNVVRYIPHTVIEIFEYNCNDLELGRFKVIPGQRSRCQSIAHRWFPIRLPLTPSSYLSPFLRYLTLKIFFHRSNGED